MGFFNDLEILGRDIGEKYREEDIVIEDTIYMFKKRPRNGRLTHNQVTVYQQSRSRIIDELRGKDVNFFTGFPSHKSRKGYKSIQSFFYGLCPDSVTKKELLDEENGYMVELENKFMVYVYGFEKRGEGGRAVKVFVTQDNQNFYDVDMREEEFYKFLGSTDIGKEKVGNNGKLEGYFHFYNRKSSMRLISEYDDRLR